LRNGACCSVRCRSCGNEDFIHHLSRNSLVHYPILQLAWGRLPASLVERKEKR
jgi:hypothetical protein